MNESYDDETMKTINERMFKYDFDAHKEREAQRMEAERVWRRRSLFGELVAARDPNAPEWLPWAQTYAQVASVMFRAEQRGFFKMKDRDRDLCKKIVEEQRITRKQRSWLGGLSLRYLQDGVFEGSTWWARGDRNLVTRWNAILDAARQPDTTIEELEEVTGSQFMARYQKVLEKKV